MFIPPSGASKRVASELKYKKTAQTSKTVFGCQMKKAITCQGLVPAQNPEFEIKNVLSLR